MEFVMVKRAVPPLVGCVKIGADAKTLREAVHNAAKCLSSTVVANARALQMKVAGFLALCGTSTAQRGQSMPWLLSSIKPSKAKIRLPLRLGRGVRRGARQKKWLCAGAVAALQLARAHHKKWLWLKPQPINFHGARVLAGLILAGSPASVRQGFKLQTSGNAKIWPEKPTTNSTISAIARKQVSLGASLSRNAMCSQFFRLGKCIRLHEHFMP